MSNRRIGLLAVAAAFLLLTGVLAVRSAVGPPAPEGGCGSSVLWADIAAGRYDTVLQRRAAALIAFGSPVVFSFNHEPENDPAAGNASDFVAAYRHIHDVFQKAGGATSPTRGR